MSSRRANDSAISRLKLDYMRLKKDPVPYIEAEPVPSNILEWYFYRFTSAWHSLRNLTTHFKLLVRRYYVVRGPENTPYEGGYYLGRLVFPKQFPFKPPSIYMLTPNGR